MLMIKQNPEGFKTTYSYDMLGRMTKRIHPDAGETRYTYDNAGNLTKEINPLGQINYDYTYYRLLKKRYSSMTGNDVTYTYGTGGTETGRPVRIVDGSGMYECRYDALGNVTDETRTIALPQHGEVYRFRMLYRYDSWGRMLSMTYPDGEEVAYTYLWGGDLYSMHGTKGANHRVYVSKILYNTFGQRSQVEYGNRTKAYYTYDALHRLVKLKSRNGSGTQMQDISYTFDSASNVTGITNTAGIVNSLGGGYANSYRYDALHRLVWSSGGGAMGSYSMDMGYTPSGRIGEKNRLTHLGTFSETVETIYGYCDTYQPHAVRRIYDRAKGIHHDLRWDGAGNLGQISVANEDALFESGRFLFWTEDSRMHAAVDEKYYSYYTYDHGGERRLKLTGENHLVDVNANYMSTYSALSRPTLYPSAYMVVNSKGYTKHYYAGAERVAARIGGGGLDALISLADGGDSLRTKASHLFTQSIGQVNNRVLEKNEPDCITGSVAEQDELKVWIEGIPEQLQASTLIDYGEFTDVVQSLRADHNGGQEREVYFYHSDHLGSASWITDSGGQAIQHLQYLPYGEPYINQRTSGYNERFTFTGKERDEETGYGYFGARYMDYELMTMWLSVDPMADKYPSISPYAYCVWNPLRLIDPDGRDTAFAGAAERTLYLNYREKVFSDDKYKQVQNELIQLEQSSEVFCVRMGENISSSSGGGNFTYNTSTGQFDINIDGNGIWTDIEKLSHELKHADQYLNRKLTLLIDTKGHATFYNYSVDDELEAYNRQGMFGNTWTFEEVYQVYHEQNHLSWYGINSQYTPSSNDIDVNTEFQKHLRHPKILYHGWENDVKQRQTR